MSLNKGRHNLVGTLVVTRQECRISGNLVARATNFCTVKPNIFSLIIALFFPTHKNVGLFTGNEQKAPGKIMKCINILANYTTYFKHTG